MKRIGITVSMLVLAGSVASSAFAANGILLKDELGTDSNYCHTKFQAIKEETLWRNNPQLKDSSSGDVIDFYGPCDESPIGPDQVKDQQRRYGNRLDRDQD